MSAFSTEPRPARAQPAPNAALRLWYDLTAPRPVSASASLAVRERNRRGRIASLMIAGILITLLVACVNLTLARAILPSLALALAGCLIAIPLNRMGHLIAVGWLLTLTLDGALAIPLLTAPGGLDPIYLPAYYLMIVPALVAVSLLPAASVFALAVANSLFIILDIRFQTHNMMWDQMITTGSELYSLLIGPVALHVIVALLAYLWVRSADVALRRADRAEDLARLERANAEQREKLAEGIQQILQTHVRFANGDLSARALASQDSALWQVSVALNNLLSRYQRLAQEDGFSRATAEQVAQAREALRLWLAGREPAWPLPVGGPLDPLLVDLRTLFGRLAAPDSMGPALGGSGVTGGPSGYGAPSGYGLPSGPSAPLRRTAPPGRLGGAAASSQSAGSLPETPDDWRQLPGNPHRPSGG